MRNQAKHTGQVGESGLSTDEGGAANGCAHGGRGADGGAHGAGAEESGCHCVVSFGGIWVEQGVVGLQWREQRSVSTKEVHRGRGSSEARPPFTSSAGRIAST